MRQKIYDSANRPEDLERIVALLRDGGVIIYPTDTVYAIGCSALHQRAVERICQLKNIDPRKKPLSIICSDLSQVSEYAKVDNRAFRLLRNNLPGPFTFILPASNTLPKIFRGRKEVGVRIPSRLELLEVCRLLGAPILTSTVPFREGHDESYYSDPELIDELWGDQVDLILDGGFCATQPSTIVNLVDDDIEIVRQGEGKLML